MFVCGGNIWCNKGKARKCSSKKKNRAHRQLLDEENLPKISFRWRKIHTFSYGALRIKALQPSTWIFFFSISGVLVAHYALGWSLMNAFGRKANAHQRGQGVSGKGFSRFHWRKICVEKRWTSSHYYIGRERNCGWMTWRSTFSLFCSSSIVHCTSSYRFLAFVAYIFCWVMFYVMHPDDDIYVFRFISWTFLNRFFFRSKFQRSRSVFVDSIN